MDCGSACLVMATAWYGKTYPLQYFREQCHITREGVSLRAIGEAAKQIGMDKQAVKATVADLTENAALPFPCILHWNQNHFVVLYKIVRHPLTKKRIFKIADPGHGLVKLSEEVFKKAWLSDGDKGVALFLFPTEAFYEKEPPKPPRLSFKYLLSYLRPYKADLVALFALLLLGSSLTLVFPFLTQWLVDKGVTPKDVNMVFMVLLAQLFFFTGNVVTDIFRNWITLVIGTRLSITIISEFLKKLLRLPLKFFETKTIGDFRQRISDNDRIEDFLTSQSLVTFFSLVSFSVFFGVLCYYDLLILAVYLVLTVLSVLWSFYWLSKRKVLDYDLFQQRTENQDSIYEMLNGVTEMKLNAFETFKRRQWEGIQQKLLGINKRILRLDQIQLSGFQFLNQLKNIIVTFMAAIYVIEGRMTLGELLSVSYIIGQMNSPVSQLVGFFRSLQFAKLSMERLSEVQHHPEEEQQGLSALITDASASEKGIRLHDISFQYEGSNSPFVLKDVSLFISEGKVTAIVGASGSGKTTLVKLLLKFYEPSSGRIDYNRKPLENISPASLRKHSGIVMQDGFIFSDTIARNIACGDEHINADKLRHAVETANIGTFIDSLPLGFNTKIGASGIGISGGQRQRILIARAVYKNPRYIFFDEATSALDAENEKIIHDNLQLFFEGKTVVIVAHRLSTVKNADQIVVLKEGQVTEIGAHKTLAAQRGFYFHLIKNQLELGG